MNPFFYFIIFIFGSCVGSFLNCVVYRLESSESFLKGRSFCPRCKHKLGFLDLIPILSFITLRGRCRYCREKISWQYPAVEIATGIIFTIVTLSLSEGSPALTTGFLAAFRTTSSLINISYLWLISSLLIIIFVYDLKHYIIPDRVIYPAIAIAFLFNIAVSSIVAGMGVALFFFLLWFASQGKWLGFGDVKLGFLLGLFLGWPNILVGLFLGFLIGAIIGVGLILLGKKKLKSEVPFGPFLVTGTFAALFFGDKIINWYLNLL